ncbi:hypothetical protein [Nostoc sp. FACHB-110]|uniref:hypothetical protein n=1 Tax=Nostoc sp. FACHB-110 TaxID=2692834 RepID=UPI0016827157|nr:hypothetical protein [Nostoc sp. FACHB-110]MBD2436118.1 hypothetical protein [Nostoc sp. FACHB-110]
MRKTTLLTIAFSSLLVLPAMAQLGQVWDDFQFYSVDLQNYLRDNVNDTFRPLDIRTQGALSSNSGELNIPDPLAAGKQVRNDIIINSLSNKFENNAAVNGAIISNEINRLATRSAVSGVFGTNGQIRIKSKLQATETSIENIDKYVQDADKSSFADSIIDQACQALTSTASGGTNTVNPSVCQANIQLQSIKILAEQAKINAENLSQTLQNNQALQYSNLNLANISQQVEEANRARRVDSSAEAARLLRTTSQIDLFGRKEGN